MKRLFSSYHYLTGDEDLAISESAEGAEGYDPHFPVRFDFFGHWIDLDRGEVVRLRNCLTDWLAEHPAS